MAWLIIRIQCAYLETERSSKPDDPGICTIVQRCRAGRGADNFDLIDRLVREEGFELGPLVGPRADARDWPLTGIVYESPNKDGFGRQASTIRRWPVRRRTRSTEGLDSELKCDASHSGLDDS